MNDQSSNVVWHHATVTRDKRQAQNGHKSIILWFTGLSGAGKSSLAHAVEEHLHRLNCKTYVLDGDNVRHGLCGDLSFSVADRRENIRRIAEVAKLMMDAGVIVLTAFISPFRQDRELARKIFPHGEFLEIHCDCPIQICEQRDVKGLYKKARLGEIKEFTGISSPYEAPLNPELRVNTGAESIEFCVQQVVDLLNSRNIIAKKPASSQ